MPGLVPLFEQKHGCQSIGLFPRRAGNKNTDMMCWIQGENKTETDSKMSENSQNLTLIDSGWFQPHI